MKMIYRSMMLAGALFAGIITADAQKRYTVAGGFQGGGELTSLDIAPDQPIILMNGNVGEPDAISATESTGKSKYLTDGNIFYFESTGQKDAEDFELYRLKRQNGEYVLAVSGETVQYTNSQTRAWVFKVKDAVQYASAEEMDIEGQDYTTATLSNANMTTVILSDKGMTSTSAKADRMQLVSGAAQAPASFGSNDNQNVWMLYTAEELEGSDYIYDALAEYFPEGSADLYNVGDQPGQISQALYDELTGSYNDANLMAEEGTASQEECIAAIDRCLAAIQAAADGAVKVKEGYYYFRGNRTENNATYDDGNGLRWVPEWTEPEVPTAQDAKYIWKLIYDEEHPGFYFIQNYFSKRYVGTATKWYQSIPTTDGPEYSYHIYPRTKDDFLMESSYLAENPIISGGVKYNYLHQQENGLNVVVWEANTDPSGWRFFTVDPAQIEAIDKVLGQYKLQVAMEELIEKAQAAYQKGFSYKSNATKDHLYETEGLLSDGKVWSNALETSEGSYGALFDNDATTFFHSRWSGELVSDAFHYIACDLGTAIKNIQFKMTRRYRANHTVVNNYPTLINVYACNDTTGLSTGGEVNWVNIGNYTPNWSIDQEFAAAEEGGEPTVVADGVAIMDVLMPEAYRYIRLDVEQTGAGSGVGTFFNLGALQAYASEYDQASSLIEAVPAAQREALLKAIADGEAELENEYVEQATIDALQAAYDAFMEVFPDPSVLDDLVTEAKAQAAAAVEGTSLGYFQTGAKAALEGVLAAQEPNIKPVMTLDEIASVKKALEDALAAFNAALIKPVNGTIYFIQSGTETTQADSATNAYLYAAGNGQGVKWAHDAAGDVSKRLAMRWKAIERDGGYVFQNMLTGEYMDNTHKNDVLVNMSTQADTCVINLRSAKVGGLFNLVMIDGVYLNAQPRTGDIVTWGSAEGADNSAFRFTEATPWTGYELQWPVAQGLQIITLPIDVTFLSGEGAYSVIGVNGANIELAEIDGEVKAGTPFFYNNIDEAVSEVTFGTNAATIDQVVWAAEATAQNGLQGTLASTEVPHDYGRLLEGIIVHTTQDEAIPANSGYIIPGMPETTETGALQVAVEGGVIDGIATIITGSDNTDVYTIAGVKVRSNVKGAAAVKGLPAGLYIINGKKVLVK